MDFANDPGNLDHVARQAVAQPAVLFRLHLAGDGLQLLAELLALFVVLLDLGDLRQQLVQLSAEIFVGNDELGQHQDIAHGSDAALQIVAQLNDLADDQRRTRERFANRPLAAFIALGQLDFALAGEQRNGAHLAQIHADRIVGFVANILGEFQVAEIVGLILGGFFEIEFGLFQDLDAGAIEVREQILEFAAGREIFGDQLVHFVVQNEPLFLARVHEIL